MEKFTNITPIMENHMQKNYGESDGNWLYIVVHGHQGLKERGVSVVFAFGVEGSRF